MSSDPIDIQQAIQDSEDEIAVFIAAHKKFKQLFETHFNGRSAMRYEVDDALLESGHTLEGFEKYLDRVFGAHEYITETDFKQHTNRVIAAQLKKKIQQQ